MNHSHRRKDYVWIYYFTHCLRFSKLLYRLQRISCSLLSLIFYACLYLLSSYLWVWKIIDSVVFVNSSNNLRCSLSHSPSYHRCCEGWKMLSNTDSMTINDVLHLTYSSLSQRYRLILWEFMPLLLISWLDWCQEYLYLEILDKRLLLWANSCFNFWKNPLISRFGMILHKKLS